MQDIKRFTILAGALFGLLVPGMAHAGVTQADVARHTQERIEDVYGQMLVHLDRSTDQLAQLMSDIAQDIEESPYAGNTQFKGARDHAREAARILRERTATPPTEDEKHKAFKEIDRAHGFARAAVQHAPRTSCTACGGC